ncbi:MAG: DUF5677 domain-containing protein [Candidatus Dojkabacteria bacterium]
MKTTPKFIENKYEKLILDLIKKTDLVFDDIGRELPRSGETMVLEALGFTSFHIASAIILLCRNGFSQEAMILLRSLIENTVNLKWILNKEKEERIGLYFHDIKEEGFGAGWTEGKNLEMRMSELGFKREYYDKVVKVTHSFSHVNAESLDWSSVKSGYPRIGEEAILAVVYQMLGHVLEVLNKNISEKFSYKEVFEELKKTRIKNFI